MTGVQTCALPILSVFSQFNRHEDLVQLFFAFLTGEDPDTWSEKMRAAVAAIESRNPNFTSFTAPGTDHCVINQPAFYTTEVGGVRLVDWVRTLATEARPEPVR